MPDIALSRVELNDLRLIDVEADAPESGRREGSDKRQTDVTQTDDSDNSTLGPDQFVESGMTWGK